LPPIPGQNGNYNTPQNTFQNSNETTTEEMLVGISGDINSGKDVVGRMFQYLTSEYQNKYSFENWLDRVDKYKSDPYSPIEIKKFADKLKDMVCVLLSCTRKVWKTGNSRTPIRRTLEKWYYS
jgi:hypothetical protein